MGVRRLIASAGYAPDAVAALAQVYDDAWAVIEPGLEGDAALDRASQKLAGIIMLMGCRISDPAELKRVALHVMARNEDEGASTGTRIRVAKRANAA